MDRMVVLKMGGDVIGATISALVGILAAGDSTPLTYSAIVAVLGFAGLLVRQLSNTQKLYVGIVEAKDRELHERDDTIHYLRWEMEALRFRHGERALDPGPYIPRRPTGAIAS